MSDSNTGPEAPQGNETDAPEGITPDVDTDAGEGRSGADDDAQTYPAEVVRKLRDENAKARTRARDAETRADELARALFTARVAATGKVVDPDAIDYDADILDDADAINERIDAALTERPYLKPRRPSGSVGQGAQGAPDTAPTFASLLQTR